MPRIVIAVKGGAGSGNWGHTGRPGLRGGSGGGMMVSIDATFPSKYYVEKWIRTGELDSDAEYVLRIGGKVYDIRTEGWWDDCMESRGLGVTSYDTIDRSFRDVMVMEAGWSKADIAGYVAHTSQGETYGVTYIGKLVEA